MKKCIITNGPASWILEVDGKKILFQGGDAANYFFVHYTDLGYDVTIIEQS